MPTLYDYAGQPIKTSSLTKELAAPTLSGVRTNWHISVATGLTPENLAAILSAVDDMNDMNEYLTLAEEMEQRDMHYASVLSTRKNAVSGLDMMVEAASDDAEDVKIRDFVDGVIQEDATYNLAADQLDALGKGFSVDEIMWDTSEAQWVPREYRHRDQRFFQFDIKTRQELRLRDEDDLVNGLALAPFKFIQHRPHIKTGIPIRGGLARLAVVSYMCKGYTLKDWMAFAEVFGMPLRVGKHGTDATDAQKTALLSAVASIGTDAACIIPENMIIEFIESAKAVGGERLFEGLANWLDKQVSKGVLGQTATTEGTPGRLGNDKAQMEVREDIKVADAKQLSATLRRDLVKPLVDLNFGPRKRGQYPKLRIVIEEPEDLEALSKSLPEFIDRGLRVEASVIRDMFSLPEPEPDAEVLQPKSGGAPAPSNPEDEPPPKDEPEPEVDDEDAEAEQALQREQRETIRALMKTVRSGKALTADQRVLLVAAVAAQAKTPAPGDDELDRLADGEVDNWQQVMDPVLQPILDHAKASNNYEEFLAGLEDAAAGMDSTALAERLAVATYKSRGRGDATDDT